MFKFLKDKLKASIAKISKAIDIEATSAPIEESAEAKPAIEIKEGPTAEELLKELEDMSPEELEKYDERPEKAIEEEKPEEELEQLFEQEAFKEEPAPAEAQEETELPIEPEAFEGEAEGEAAAIEEQEEIKEAEEPVSEEEKEPAAEEEEKQLFREEKPEQQFEPEEAAEEIREQKDDKELEEEKPVKKSFFAKIKEKFRHSEELPLEGFEEVQVKTELDEQREAAAKRKAEEERILAEKNVREKLDKNKVPTIQDLAERKPEEKVEEIRERVRELKGEIKKERIKPKEGEIERTREEIAELNRDIKEVEEKGFFGRLKEKIINKKIDGNQFENLFWDLEIALLENNVAVEIIDKIKRDLKDSLVGRPLRRTQISSIISSSLKNSIEDALKIESFDLLQKIKQKKPFVICFFGINGSGKTTTIAKVARLLQQNRLSVVLAASDTFRAASIEQLQRHADNLGIKLIKHNYGSDPAAVAYDAIEHAKSNRIDAVLIDTAGRQHSNINLMEEMKKIVRVAKPNLKIFIGESITGNDCVEQAKAFDEAIGVDAIILAKADIDEKGGAAVSVSYVTKKPIIYLGVGQNYEDLQKFDVSAIMQNLGLSA